MKNTKLLLFIFLTTLFIPLFNNQASAGIIHISFATVKNISCHGDSDGAVSVVASGGLTPYTYFWYTNPFQRKDTATGLSVGSYTVVVEDANSDTSAAIVTVTQSPTLIDTAYPIGNVTCNGGYSGVAAVHIAGGTSPYSYVWIPFGGTNDTVTGMSAGCYTVTATDANGCTMTSSTCITQPNQLVVNAFVFSGILCNGGSGCVAAHISGGVPPYTYIWTGGQTTDTACGVIAGTYTLSVTDNNGCSGSSVATLTQPSAISIVSSSTTDTGSCSGTATDLVTGGNSPYTYLWSPGGATVSAISNLCAGVYCCTVTDNNGCIDTNCLTVNSCSNNFNEQICIVTLDTATNKCEIIWGRVNSPPAGGYGNYNIYRDTNNTDTLIHSQPLNVLSEYIDPLSNPSAGPVSYKLSTVDSCGESALSPIHTSIYLTTTAGFNVYILNWTAYVGFTPLEYVIFRGPSLSQLTPIDTVANNVYTFHDTLPPLGSFYVLEAVSPSPCIPSLHSVKNALFSGALSNGFNTGTLLGMNNISNAVNNLKVYPNPNTGSFTVSYSMPTADNVTISIVNELGQCIYQEKQKHAGVGINTEQLNLGSIASGIYSLRIQSNNGITVKKLLIMPNK